MGKRIDDKKTMIYRYRRNYQDLVRTAIDEKAHEPLVDIYATQDQLRVEVELPGVLKGDVEVYSIGNRLYIRAFKREDIASETEDAPRGFLCLEREFGEYYREIELIVACDTSKGKAKFAEGVLTIELPKVVDRRGIRKDLPID